MLTTGQIILLAVIAGIAGIDKRVFGALSFDRPIVLGPLVGLVLGDLKAGLVLGGTLEMIWMGVMRIGGAVPPNIVIGGILGTAFAITSGTGIESALLVAVPASLIGSAFEVFVKTINSFFIHRADAYAEQGNARGIAMMLHLGNVLFFLITSIPVFLALQFGGEAVQSLLTSIPEALTTSLKTVGHILPALGFGILLNSLGTTKLLPFFFIGFVLASFLGISIIGAAILGVAVAFLIQTNAANGEA